MSGSKKHAMFPEEYIWIMKQMKKRIPSYDGDYPIWLWTEKPDLRRGGHLNRGAEGVLLEVELAEDVVLISDFDAWHCVLNKSFCPLTEEEYKDYRAGRLVMTKEESWERIFSLELFRESEWWNNSPQCLQGTTGRIELSSVKKIRPFIAK